MSQQGRCMCSAAGCSLARQSAEALSARSWGAAKTFVFAHTFWQDFEHLLPRLRHWTTRHTGFCNAIGCHVGTTFDVWVGWDGKRKATARYFLTRLKATDLDVTIETTLTHFLGHI